MLRLGLLLLALLTTAAASLPDAAPLRPSPAFTQAGPANATGALVWLHGSYDTDLQPTSPPEAGWVGRMAQRNYDIWRFDRTPGRDPLEASSAALIEGLGRLRAAGYRHIVVSGQSRGAFIALAALAHPELVDAVAALSPAAHGTRPERRAQAIADFRTRLDAARGTMRVAMVQMRDDPLELGPEIRVAELRAMVARSGDPLLLIDRPPNPTGHMGIYEPEFDAIFGACLARFVDATAPLTRQGCDSGL